MRISRTGRWAALDGTVLTIRPIREADGSGIASSLRKLSPETRRLRFLGAGLGDDDDFVRRVTTADPASNYALLVVRREGRQEIPVAGGRITAGDDAGAWELALLVGDAWQGQGLGKRLLSALIVEARRRQVGRLVGHISVDNRPMLALARNCSFSIARDPGDSSICVATLDLPLRQGNRSWWSKWIGG
jgi:GNAT superfamily N-acetyltransferase